MIGYTRATKNSLLRICFVKLVTAKSKSPFISASNVRAKSSRVQTVPFTKCTFAKQLTQTEDRKHVLQVPELLDGKSLQHDSDTEPSKVTKL